MEFGSVVISCAHIAVGALGLWIANESERVESLVKAFGKWDDYSRTFGSDGRNRMLKTAERMKDFGTALVYCSIFALAY